MKFLFLFFLSIQICYASVNYSLGTFVPYFNKAQVANDGSTQTFDLNPYLGVGTQIHLIGDNYFLPQFGLTYFNNTAKKINKNILFLHYDFGYIVKNRISLRYGFTTHWLRIGGEGGTLSLSNGGGVTDFKSPSTPVTSYFTTVDLGLEYFFNRIFTVRFDVNTMNFTNSDNTSMNYLLTINYYR